MRKCSLLPKSRAIRKPSADFIISGLLALDLDDQSWIP